MIISRIYIYTHRKDFFGFPWRMTFGADLLEVKDLVYVPCEGKVRCFQCC